MVNSWKENSFDILNETFEYSSVPMFWCDENHFILFNQSFTDLTGYTKSELLSLSPQDISWPEQPLILKSEFNHDNREFKNLLWVINTKDDQKISVEIRLTQFFLSKTRRHYYGMIHILQDQEHQPVLFKELIDRYKYSLITSKQAFWDWRVAEDSIYCSNEYYNLLGYKPQEFSVNYSTWLDFLHEDDRIRVTTIWKEFLKYGLKEYKDDFRLRKSNGQYLWVQYFAKVHAQDSKNMPLRIIGIVKDIHEEKLASEKIKVQTQKLIDYAFYNSHELRGPLATLLGLIGLMKDEGKSGYLDSLTETAKKLDEAVHKINRIIEEDDYEGENLNKGLVRKVSLLTRKRVMHITYQRTIEEFSSNIDVAFFENPSDFLVKAMKDSVEDDMILIDLESNEELLDLLSKIENLDNDYNVFLLVKMAQLEAALDAVKFTCVRGVVLKPISKSALQDLMLRK